MEEYELRNLLSISKLGEPSHIRTGVKLVAILNPYDQSKALSLTSHRHSSLNPKSHSEANRLKGSEISDRQK
jgi:hypothetical protein